MRSASRIIAIFCCVVLFLIGLLGFVRSLGVAWLDNQWYKVIEQLPVHSGMIVYLVLLLLPMCALGVWLIGARKERKIFIKSEEGVITISQEAIVNFVTNVVRRIPAVFSLSASVRNTPRGANIEIRARVKTVERLPNIHRDIKDRVQEGLTSVLGISDIAAIQVLIEDIKVDKEQGPSSPGAAAGTDETLLHEPGSLPRESDD